MSFDKAFASTMKSEGGYTLIDGHETFMGIDRVKHPEWLGWSAIDYCKQNKISFTHHMYITDAVRNFYYDEFWLKPKLDKLNDAIACECFEAGVNCGPSNGVKFLQRALRVLGYNIGVDGKIGNETLKAVNDCLVKGHIDILVRCQNGEQYCYYKDWSKHADFPGVFRRT